MRTWRRPPKSADFCFYRSRRPTRQRAATEARDARETGNQGKDAQRELGGRENAAGRNASPRSGREVLGAVASIGDDLDRKYKYLESRLATGPSPLERRESWREEVGGEGGRNVLGGSAGS